MIAVEFAGISSLSLWRECDLVALLSDPEHERKLRALSYSSVDSEARAETDFDTIHATMNQHLHACLRQAPS